MSTSRSTLAAAAALAVAACSSEDSGRISIQLTDAAGDVGAAVVTISRISLHGSGGDLVLSDVDVTVDLVTLADSTVQLVKDAVVPTGTYSELRFQITGGYVAVDPDGAGTRIYASSPTYEGLPAGAQIAGELKMPSYAQSGLKVKADMAPGSLVVTSRAKVLLVDFDVSQSFGHDAGGSDSWVMHPVIQGADILLSGNVVATLALGAGVTLPTLSTGPVGLEDFTAVLTSGEGSVEKRPFLAAPGGTYVAAFHWQLPGAYTLAVEGPAGVTCGTSPRGDVAVTLPPGGDAIVPFTLTSASLSAP